MRRIVASSRYLFIIAVVSTFLLSVVTFIYGAVLTFKLIVGVVSPKAAFASAKAVIVEAIEIVDFFLIATVLYIIALGLYALFIDENLSMPAWLEVKTLQDVKAKLIGVLIVVLSVFFLAQVMVWKGGIDLLFLGVATAIMVFALSFFLSEEKGHR